MKEIIIVIMVLLACNNLSAQDATPGWLKQEMDVYPLRYKISQFGLSGKVKYVKRIFNNPRGEEELFFDLAGRLTKREISSGITTRYEYDYSSKGTIVEKVSGKASIFEKDYWPATIEYYSIEKDGRIKQKSLTGENSSKKWILKTLYNYNTTGMLLNQKRYDNDTLKNIISYKYDGKNRLVERNKNDDEFVNFSYLMKDENLVITFKAEKSYLNNNVYTLDKLGFNIIEQTKDYTSYVQKYSYKYDFDNQGNWIKQTKIDVESGILRDRNEVSTREIKYY